METEKLLMKTERVLIMVEPDLKEKASKYAQDNHKTLSQLIRELLRKEIK